MICQLCCMMKTEPARSLGAFAVSFALLTGCAIGGLTAIAAALAAAM
jgi:hypothetical protein